MNVNFETSRVTIPAVKKPVFSQILTLKLLSVVLPSWNSDVEPSRVQTIVDRLINLLGSILVSCSADPTLVPQSKSLTKRLVVQVSGVISKVCMLIVY